MCGISERKDPKTRIFPIVAVCGENGGFRGNSGQVFINIWGVSGEIEYIAENGVVGGGRFGERAEVVGGGKVGWL